jgi:hypothetical protein
VEVTFIGVLVAEATVVRPEETGTVETGATVGADVIGMVEYVTIGIVTEPVVVTG